MIFGVEFLEKHFNAHQRIMLLTLLCFFVSVEIVGVSFLTGCSRRVGSSQVLFQRKIRKDVLAEKAKAEVNASDLPPEIKSEVNQRIDQVPVADSDREQISAILNELVKALKDGKATPAQLTKIAASAVVKLSELNTDDPSKGLLPMLQRPEIAEAIEILKREGLPEEEILKAVLHQADPTLVTNPQATAEILQDPLFSDFSQGSKTAVLAGSGDPNAQRQSQIASAVTEAIEEQGFPLAVASALQLSVVNVPPKGSAQADAEAILVTLNETAQNQSVEPAPRAELLLDAVDAILGSSSSFTSAEAEQLFKTAFGILTESGVSGAMVVIASIARLPAEKRDTAAEIDTLLASSLYEGLSPAAKSEAKQSLYERFVPSPVISSIASQSVLEDRPTPGIAFQIQDADSILSCLDSVTATSSSTQLMPSERIVITGNAPDCEVVASPAENQNGVVTITLRVSDGFLSSETHFELTVDPENDAPTISTAGDTTNFVPQDGSSGVALATAWDPDVATNGQSLGYFISQNPTHGTLGTLPASGATGGGVTYTPQTGYVGTDSFSYLICDSFSAPVCTTLQTVSMIVTNVNDAPTDISLFQTSLNEDAGANAVVGTLSSTDPDTGNTFTYSLVTGTGDTDNLSFNISSDNLRMTVSADYETKNSYSVRIRTTDNGGLSFEKSFVISIGDLPEATWSQEAFIKTPNPDSQDLFGSALDVSGDLLAVGSAREDSNETVITNGTTASTNNGSPDSGAVYVYRRSGVLWEQEAYIKAANTDSDDKFGSALALVGDTLVVGAWSEGSNQSGITNGTTASTDNSLGKSGAAYVYRRTGQNWAQEAYIKSPYPWDWDIFGDAVALDRDLLAVGAAYEQSPGNIITNGPFWTGSEALVDSGAAYIFRRSGTQWETEAYLKAVNVSKDALFGRAVSLSGDTLAVGAEGDASAATSITNGTTASSETSAQATGAVYIYRRTGLTWRQEAYIKAVNGNGGERFGRDVALSGDTLAVASQDASNQTTITNGTTASSDNSAWAAGAVYIYRRAGNSWSQEAFIKSSDSASLDDFGESISLSGNTLAVGARWKGNGAAYVFRRNGTSWYQEATLLSANSDSNDQFGSEVSIFGDTVAISAHLEDSSNTIITNGTGTSTDNSRFDSGAVYVYRGTGRVFDPHTVSVQSLSTGSFSVTWSDQNRGSGSGVYKVVYGTTTPSAMCSNGTVIHNGTGMTATVASGLSPGQTYFVRVCQTDGTTWSEGVVQRVTIQGDSTPPTILSINRGTSANPVSTGPALIDYLVTFSEPVAGIRDSNFSFTETGSNSGATGVVRNIDCSAGSACRVWVQPLNAGNLRLDLVSPSGITDIWGTPLTDTRLGDQTYTLQGWYQEAYIKAANAESEDSFGWSVSLSGDTLAVGAYREDENSTTIANGTTAPNNNGASDSGAVYIYRRTGATWSQEAYIKTANAQATDYFGYSVALSGDTLAVGAISEDENSTIILNGTTAPNNNGASNSGAVYIYRRTGMTWAPEAYIKAANAESNDEFGNELTLSGETLAVGVNREDENSTTIVNGTTAPNTNGASNSGAVYIYRRTGVTWEREAYIKAANAGADDRFGYDVSLFGDTLSVGAPGENENSTTIVNGTTAPTSNGAYASGAVYVYRRTGVTWTQEAYIKAANAEAFEWFGFTVRLSGDTLAVGTEWENENSTTIINGTTAPNNNGADSSGAVYVYRRIGVSWTPEAYIKAANAEANDYFGVAVSLSGDTLAVGANEEDEGSATIVNGTTPPNEGGDSNENNSFGAVYVYRRTGVNWAQEAYIKAANAEAPDFFGGSVSLSGDTLAVGTVWEDENSTTIVNGPTAPNNNGAADSGAVYLYRNNARIFDPDVRVSATTQTSITFTWGVDLGPGTTQIIVAPAASGTGTPVACQAGGVGGSQTLTPAAATYTYSGLTAGTRYGFRFCTTDGTTISSGANLWAETSP